MLNYKIIIKSKNIHALNLFILFCLKKNLTNLKTIYIKKRKKIIPITLPRSPHVHKKAQEQFEYRIFSKTFKILTDNDIEYLIFLKKIKTKLFPEIKLKIVFLINKIKELTKRQNLIKPSNFFINKKYFCQKDQKYKKLYYFNSFNTHKKIKQYLKIFDCYGEIKLYKNLKSLDNSVGRV